MRGFAIVPLNWGALKSAERSECQGCKILHVDWVRLLVWACSLNVDRCILDLLIS
jgi:hypothetical protein